MKPLAWLVYPHNSNERSLQMIDFENTTNDGMRVAERMNKQPNEKIAHESQNVRILGEKHNWLLLQNHAVNLV